jgi:hypothetical protein
MDMTLNKKLGWLSAMLLVALAIVARPQKAVAQDQQDDPPSRVARLGYMQGSVSFQPAGESEWVQAVANRPMTTGDKLWADKDSRAELQLGTAVIRLDANTGFSFLNLDDRTAQIQLTSGSINISVRRLDRDDVFEVDTPNQAFSVYQPGSYRVEASEDGSYTVVSVRRGEGESTGNGQNFTLHAGQKGTFSGTDSLTADVVQIGGPDEFDNWANTREHRYDDSRSAQYVSHDVVGYDDLDDNGDWRDDSNYGHVWYPNRVAVGWAPYHDGHWDWISPWGWTWVDDSSWGYAPFHYGRWVTVGGRWGWVAGPVAVRAVYAPALVVFIGSGGVGFGGNVGWFPLGPREVYVPSYHVSREYVNRVNISNTTVNNVTITNVYNTTIVNKNTNITNVTYVNRNVRGAVTAVPQRAFVSAQPVGRAAIVVSARDIASAPMSSRVAVAPTRESVLGARASTANRVAAPPTAVANRQVIAKAPAPPPPVPFARQQRALAEHPGEPLARSEVRTLRPAAAAEAHPLVRQAPPGKPATPNMGRPGNQPNQPANQPGAARPGQPGNAAPENQPSAARPGQPANAPPENRPANRPGNQPAPNERPGAANPAQPNRPPSAQPNQPAPTQPNRPEMNRPAEPPARNDRPPSTQPNRSEPAQPGNRPEPNRRAEPPARNERPPSTQPNRPEPAQPGNRPETNRPAEPPARNNRPPSTQPNQPEPAQPGNRPEPNRRAEPPTRNERPPSTQPNRPEPAQPTNRPEPSRNQPAPRPQSPSPSAQPRTPPAETKPAPPPERQRKKAQTPEEKKREQEQQKPPRE